MAIRTMSPQLPHAPTWPKSWRNTPRPALRTTATTTRMCMANELLLPKSRGATRRPRDSMVRRHFIALFFTSSDVTSEHHVFQSRGHVFWLHIILAEDFILVNMNAMDTNCTDATIVLLFKCSQHLLQALTCRGMEMYGNYTVADA